MIYVTIQGNDIYEHLRMPEAPRKGDHLWLSSLCSRSDLPTDVLVSRVEWARDQTARFTDREHEGVHVLVTVRRITPRPEPSA